MFSSVASHPVVACVARRREVDHGRQRGEQRIVRTFVAAEEAADDARALGAAATELVDERQRRRRASEHRHVGRRPHPGRARQDVRVALREHDEVSLAQTDRLLADRVSPARAARDQVVFDDALGARHHHRRQSRATAAPPPPTESSARSRSTPHRSDGPREARPRGRQLSRDTSCAGRAGIRFGRRGRSSAALRTGG